MDLFSDKEDSGRGITFVIDTEIQAKNEERIPQNMYTKRATPWSTRVLGCKGDKSLIRLGY